MKNSFVVLFLFFQVILFSQETSVFETYDPSIFKKNEIKSYSILYWYDSIISNETILDKAGRKYCTREWNIEFGYLGDWSKVYYFYTSFGKLRKVHAFGSAYDSLAMLPYQTHYFYNKSGELTGGEFGTEFLEKYSIYHVRRKQKGDTLIQMGKPRLPFEMREYFVKTKLVKAECRLFFREPIEEEPTLIFDYRYNVPISENILPCKTDSFGVKFQELINEEKQKNPGLSSYNIVYRTNYQNLDEIEVALNDVSGLPQLIIAIDRRDMKRVQRSKIFYKK